MNLSPDDSEQDAPPPSPGISRWEWFPAALLPVLAVVHFAVAEPSGALSRLSLFVGAALLPGTIARLCGRSSWSIHRVFFALGLVAFVLDNPELRPDRDSLRKITANWRLVALGFLVSFSQSVFGALRAQRLLADSGAGLTKYAAFKLCLAGAFFNIFLPGSNGGDAYRVYALTHVHGMRLSRAIASMTLDRFLGLPPLIAVVLLGMALEYEFFRNNRLLSGLLPFIGAAAAVCAGIVLYLALAGKNHRKRGGAAAEERKRGRLRRVHAMLAANVTRRGTLPLALLYGFVSHAACIVSCLCFGLALGVAGVPPLRYFLIVPLAMTINAVPGAPGGAGQGELAMATLLDMAAPGLGNAGAGVMVMLLFRLSGMLAGLLGGLFYALGKKAEKRGGAEEWR